jgi:hypothetical protein
MFFSIIQVSAFAGQLGLSGMVYGVKKVSLEQNLDVKGYHLVLNKKLLNKPFLMTASIVEGPPVALGDSLHPKVVYFKRQGDRLFLFENTSGIIISDSIPAQKLVMDFSIVEEASEELVFDFRMGMDKLIFLEGFYSDGKGEDRPSEGSFKIESSYLNRVEVRKEILFIDQAALVKRRDSKGKFSDDAIQIKYTLREYTKRVDFPSKESLRVKKVGFFEVAPTFQLGSGRSNIKVMKFDISKPVTYHISSNIPKEFVGAVRLGILYWNKAFGKEVLKVETLPAGVTVHDPGYNIVQWVDYDSAGFAYADMQADPFTGEIMQSHVYMTSVFAVGGLKRAKDLLIKLATTSNVSDESKKKSFSLKGFRKEQKCNHHARTSNFSSLVETMLKQDLSEDAILRFAQDYVISVVAHEVGHTLGLRHNFAGNTYSNLGSKKFDELMEDYMKTGKMDEKFYVSSSVMDYMVTADEVLQGASIRMGHPAFAYDKAAIDWGYTDKKVTDLNVPDFCSDREKGTRTDCVTWDRLGDVFDTAHHDFLESLSGIPYRLAFTFLRAKAPWDMRDKKELRDVKLSPKSHAARIGGAYSNLLSKFSANAKYLQVDSKFPYISDFNSEEIKKLYVEMQTKGMSDLGGVKKVIFSQFVSDSNKPLPFFAPLYAKYREIITSDEFISGVDSKGRKYAFTAKELLFMDDQGKAYLKKLEGFLLEKLASSLGSAKGIQGANPELLENELYRVAEAIILKDSDREVKGSVNSKEVSVKKSHYSLKLRVHAVKLLGRNFYKPWSDFNMDNRAKLQKKISSRLERATGTGDKKVKVGSLPRTLRRWATEESNLILKLKTL